ncbi:CBS domain-containing protein [Pseudonocardia sp. SCN 73-27]|uniref:CBS domain-containing protein n=1 Tax=Pseudonocardia sp. SCN 73-27 TaxID=1660132 RepID=UPI00267DA86D
MTAATASSSTTVDRRKPTWDGVSVGAAMIREQKTSGPATLVADARAFFLNDHVHALLVVYRAVLISVVERGDLVGSADALLAAEVGRLTGRTVTEAADAGELLRQMNESGRRRFAVVDDMGRLVGLLCRKRSGTGFCSDEGVRQRRPQR